MTEQEAIPQILEFMRENLCYHDIRSDYFRDYFRDYLQDQVYDHFVHEFHSFAVSPYDLSKSRRFNVEIFIESRINLDFSWL